MNGTILILALVAVLIVGIIVGWKARTYKDQLDLDIERVFEDALRESMKE